MTDHNEPNSMQRREADTCTTFNRYERKRVIALATLRNIARDAEEYAGLLPPGTADRAAMQTYADELWRGYTHTKNAGHTPVLFAATTQGIAA